MKFYFESMEKKGLCDYVLTFKTAVSWFERVFLRLTAGTAKYRGDGTVWHEYPSGKRCATWKEGMCYNVWQRELWKEEEHESST